MSACSARMSTTLPFPSSPHCVPTTTTAGMIAQLPDRKSTRLNSSHANISYAVFCSNHTATTQIYTLSLHDALPICRDQMQDGLLAVDDEGVAGIVAALVADDDVGMLGKNVDDLALPFVTPLRSDHNHRGHDSSASRSEEHTSELQSRQYLVCRLLL